MTSASEHLEAIRDRCRPIPAATPAENQAHEAAVAALVLVQEAITSNERIIARHRPEKYVNGTDSEGWICSGCPRVLKGPDDGCDDHEDAVVALAALKGNT